VQEIRIQEAGMSRNEEDGREESKEEEVWCVVLDAGHGGIDGGTYHNDVLEKDINLAITMYIAEALESQELEIILTRSEDAYLALEDRTYIANRADADLFVSIHCNYYEGKESVSGIECYYYPKSKDGKQCAEIVNGILKEEHSFNVRSPKADDLYVLEKTDMTAILVEVGYISDSKDRQNLTRKDYQMLLADKLAEGIVASLEELKSQKE
jgi:N-acetylmuramoyl-L-alanine amidase